MTDLRSMPGDEAVTEAIFHPAGLLSRMLAFEAALAGACADVGLVPADAAERIAQAIGDGSWIDVEDVLRGAAATGTPVIPMLSALRGRLGADGAHVHLGATSQDVVDTAMMLQVRDGLLAIESDLHRTAGRAAHLAGEHRATPMVGRTLLRHAVPISFGLRAARWLGTATRAIRRVRQLRAQTVFQLGGAAGTSLPLGERAAGVEASLGRRLGLAVPEMPWHAERDRLADIVAAMGVVAAGTGKIARDLLLLSQEELGEVDFRTGGGSSAMPHKRNPVDAVYASTAARLAAGAVSTYLHAFDHEHERAAGSWQAEWILVAEVFRSAGAGVHRVATALEGIEVNPGRMQANLGTSAGLVASEAFATALADRLGGSRARALTAELLATAARSQRHLRDVAEDDPTVTAALGRDLEAVFDPVRALGSADRFIDAALASYRSLADAEAQAPQGVPPA